MKSFFIILLLAISSFGQIFTPCDVAIDRLPALRGVRLRMPESEVLKLPVVEKPSRSVKGTRQFEAVERVQIPGTKDQPAFRFVMYEQRVISMGFYYPDISVNIDEFVNGLSNNLNLPLAPWLKHSNSRIIACPEFDITVNPTPNLLTMVDRPAATKLIRAAETERQNLSKP